MICTDDKTEDTFSYKTFQKGKVRVGNVESFFYVRVYVRPVSPAAAFDFEVDEKISI